MPLPWDLEDWLTEMGDLVIHKQVNGDSLSTLEQLLYEIWLLDSEIRNGGLSQYFANHGLQQWARCKTVATSNWVPSFSPFASALDSMIAGHADPYALLIKHERETASLYDQYQLHIVGELQAAFSSAA